MFYTRSCRMCLTVKAHWDGREKHYGHELYGDLRYLSSTFLAGQLCYPSHGEGMDVGNDSTMENTNPSPGFIIIAGGLPWLE